MALHEVQEQVIKQNITTLHNRVNELGVAEPVIQPVPNKIVWGRCQLTKLQNMFFLTFRNYQNIRAQI